MANLEVENLVLESLNGQVASLSLDDLVIQHRRERKELQGKIQALKKNTPKNDKKKRKEIMEEVARWENEIEQRHKNELKNVEELANKSNSQGTPNDDDTTVTCKTNTTTESRGKNTGNKATEQITESQESQEQLPQQRVSKAQKRRDKKAREAREREDSLREELLSADLENSPKVIEQKLIAEKLSVRKLMSHHITSDGNCLYNAVRHQLSEHGFPTHSVSELRSETANYIHTHKDSLIPYMTDPATGNLLNDEEFDKYCEDVRNTTAWGGEVELNALSVWLKVAIEVLQAIGPPTIHGADKFGEPKLVITYHRYLYQLGEHYNSTMPMTDTKADDDNELATND